MTRILIIGAHPDDAEVKAGGTTRLWTRAGAQVTFVSVTDGRAGHQTMSPADLAARRSNEAEAAAHRLGADVRILGWPDGELVPSLDARLDVIRVIRRMNPDLVLTHRPNDYHPDHRYTSQLVADATYLVTVPSIASDVPALKRDPIVGYLSDRFTRPVPFRPDVVVPIDAVVEDVVDALAYHASQFYEWLPFNMGILESVPADPSARRAMLSTWYRESYCLKACDLGLSDRACGTLVEAFEISEYGLPMSDERRRAIFPFAAL